MIDDKNVDVFFDCDGVFTDGGFYSSSEGKQLKKMGADDFNAIEELEKFANVFYITADKKGYAIFQNRFEKEYKKTLHQVSGKPWERWKWIEKNAGNGHTIVYVGDGIYDYFPLKEADFGITTSSALKHTRDAADEVIDRQGGNRFVAECCMLILEKYFKQQICKIGM